MLDPKKLIFDFEEKPHKNCFSSCFGSDSALEAIDAQMFYYSFFVHFQKILTEINFVSLLFLKLKQNKNMKTILLKVFIYKRENALFQGSTIFFSSSFFGDFTLKRINAQMLH